MTVTIAMPRGGRRRRRDGTGYDNMSLLRTRRRHPSNRLQDGPLPVRRARDPGRPVLDLPRQADAGAPRSDRRTLEAVGTRERRCGLVSLRRAAVTVTDRHPCDRCHRLFTRRRRDAKWCSNACRQASYRIRHTHYALVVWGRRLEPSWQYFSTRTAALAAAPEEQPWSIVNVAAKPRLPLPTVAEIVFRTREMLAIPYPDTRKGKPRLWW